jgi:predicted TIM-barrel fold metal-dependent hydrolase
MPMEIVDAQLHAWDVDSADFPWDQDASAGLPDHLRARFDRTVTTNDLLAMMDAAGVDAAVLVSPRVYGSDHRYSFAAAANHPGRFGVVGPLSPSTPDVEERVRTFRHHPGGLGVRAVPIGPDDEGIGGVSWRRIFAPAERAEVPVFLLAPDVIDVVPGIARAYPDLPIVFDHLGAVASSSVGGVARGLERMPDLLALARFDNVALKCSNVPSLSRNTFPFEDVWPHLHAILGAFGAERLIWGSDITVHPDDLTYAQSVDYLRLSDQLSAHEKELLLGASLRRILRWPREAKPGPPAASLVNSAAGHLCELPVGRCG